MGSMASCQSLRCGRHAFYMAIHVAFAMQVAAQLRVAVLALSEIRLGLRDAWLSLSLMQCMDGPLVWSAYSVSRVASCLIRGSVAVARCLFPSGHGSGVGGSSLRLIFGPPGSGLLRDSRDRLSSLSRRVRSMWTSWFIDPDRIAAVIHVFCRRVAMIGGLDL